MQATSLVVAAAALGVNFGWQPMDDGSDGYEYIVQVEPELVEALARGGRLPIESHVPADVAPIRRIRVEVGRGDLPRTVDGTASPVERTAYRQPPGRAPRFNSNPQPNLGRAVQNVGDAFVGTVQGGAQQLNQATDQFRSGFEQNPVIQAVDNSRRQVQDTVTQPLGSNTNRGGQTVNPLESLTQGAQDLARGARDEIVETGQNLRSATEQVLGGGRYADSNSTQSSGDNYTGGPQTYRSSGDPPPLINTEREPAPSWNTTSSNQSNQSTDPGNNPFNRSEINRQNESTTGPGWPAANSPPRDNSRSVLVDSANNTRSDNGQNQANSNSASWPSNTSSTASNSNPRQYNTRQNDDQGLVPVRRDATASQSSDQAWSNDWPTSSTPPAGNANSPTTNTAFNTPPQSNQNNTTQQPNTGWPNQQQPSGNQNYANNGGAAPPASDGWDTGWFTQSPPQQAPPAQQQNYQQPGQPGQFAGQQGAVQPAGNNAAQQPSTDPSQQRWVPLLAVTVALIGSVGANLFLGFSYMDARYKYLSALRRGPGRSRDRG